MSLYAIVWFKPDGLLHETLHTTLDFQHLATSGVGLAFFLHAGLFVGLIFLYFRKNCGFLAFLFKALQKIIEGLIFFGYDCRQSNHHLLFII